MLIRSEQKFKPPENAARVFLMWTILQMQMNSDFKKTEKGPARVYLIPLTEGVYPPAPYAADPMVIHVPLKVEGVYD